MLLTIGLTAVILGMLEGGNAWAWLSVQSALCFGIGVIALVAFGIVERRVAEPIVDLRLAARRLILTTTLVSLGIGALMLGVTSFAPAYLEGSTGIAPLLSGLAVAALTLGWPLAAANAGRLYLRIGFRRTTLIGMSITTVAAIALAAVASWPNPFVIAGIAFVLGFGLGWSAGADPDRRAGLCRLGRARGGDGHERVRTVGRKRRGRRGVRRHLQRGHRAGSGS